MNTLSQNNITLNHIEDTARIGADHYTAIRSDGLAFATCVIETANTPELVGQVDRLYGTRLSRKSDPIIKMVDDATGKSDEDQQTFLRFVWNYIFRLCPPVS